MMFDKTLLAGLINSLESLSLKMMGSTRLCAMNHWGLWRGENCFSHSKQQWTNWGPRIIPWNGPLASVGLKAAPALATGNVFILKPSEKTPLMAAALGKLIIEAGFPPGVFQVLSGDGSTGALLASHMNVAKVSFTGSVQTGKTVQILAAQSNLKRVTLELGGKSPAVIFDDANLENATEW